MRAPKRFQLDRTQNRSIQAPEIVLFEDVSERQVRVQPCRARWRPDLIEHCSQKMNDRPARFSLPVEQLSCKHRTESGDLRHQRVCRGLAEFRATGLQDVLKIRFPAGLGTRIRFVFADPVLRGDRQER